MNKNMSRQKTRSSKCRNPSALVSALTFLYFFENDIGKACKLFMKTNDFQYIILIQK